MLYKSLSKLEALVEKEIASEKYTAALSHIKSFVENIIANPICDGLWLECELLDKLSQQIGKCALTQKMPPTSVAISAEKPIALTIATTLYLSGGHTAVLQDFIKNLPEFQHIVVLTDIYNFGETAAVKKRFAHLPVKFIWLSERGIFQKLLALQKMWAQINPQKVFLFNHPQDVVAVAAAQPELPGDLYFYHHSDFQLTLGLYLPHATHIDIHALAHQHCSQKIKAHGFINFPLMVPDRRARYVASSKNRLHTCSSGAQRKFTGSYAFSYAELVPVLLKKTKGQHTHIGYLSKRLLKIIKKGLVRHGVDPQQFIYVPWVESLWDTLVERSVDVYLTSFPIGGGRAGVEVMGAGIPIIAHKNYRSSFLDGLGLLYPEVFRWQTPDELFDLFVNQINSDVLKAHSCLARNYFEKNYRMYDFKEIIFSPQKATITQRLPESFLDYQLLLDIANASAGSASIKYRFLSWLNAHHLWWVIRLLNKIKNAVHYGK